MGLFKAKEQRVNDIFEKAYLKSLWVNYTFWRDQTSPKVTLYDRHVWPMHIGAMRSGWKALHDRGYRLSDPDGSINRQRWLMGLDLLATRGIAVQSSSFFQPDFMCFNK